MNSYDKIMWGKIIIPFQEVLIDPLLANLFLSVNNICSTGPMPTTDSYNREGIEAGLGAIGLIRLHSLRCETIVGTFRDSMHYFADETL